MPFTNETKRLLLSGLLLLLVNGAAMACAIFAFTEGIFADNTRAAAFPALLAFLLTFWQPWVFFLCLIPGGPSVAAFFSVPATLAIYRTGPGQRIVERLRGIARGVGPTRLTLFAAAFFLAGTSVTLAAYKDFPVRHRSLPPSHMFPAKIEGGGDKGKAAPPYFLTNSRYYTLSHFIDDECLWQVRIPREQLPAFAKALSLQRASMEVLPDRFWKQPPYWWTKPSGDLEAYQTPNANAKRGEGWNASAVYDPRTQFLYVWGENNF